MEQNVELQKMGGSGAVDPKCMGNINFEIICLTEDELWLIMPPIIIHKNPPNYLFWQRWPPWIYVFLFTRFQSTSGTG